MSLLQIHLRNFQSIRSAAIPVGRLTVVVGESNIGKSALVRALALLARNGPSTGLVRQGEEHLTVAAVFSGGTGIQIRRGARLSEYKLVKVGGGGGVFTKCGVNVPAEITKYWSLASTDLGELSFAGQHDPPFLLSQPASGVARQISAITNAHLLSDAVRETNRRRLEASQAVRSFQREADECREQLTAVADLKARRSRLEACREALTQAEAATSASVALGAVLTRSDALHEEIARLEAVTGPSNELKKLVEEADNLVGAVAKVRAAVARAKSLGQAVRQEESAAREWAHGAEQIAEDAHRMLVEAGTCPACGQEVA